MKKSFQLSAVAIAIAASSSVMADAFVIQDTDDVQNGDVYNTYIIDTDTLNSVAANTITANYQLFVAGQDVGSTLAQNTTDISTNTNTINQEIADRQIGDAAITAGIAANVTTAQLNATDATVTGTLTASAVNIVNANSVGVPNTGTSTSGISTTQKYNAGTIAGIADDVYKITEQDPSTGTLTDKYFTRNAITGNYTKVELDANQKAALPYTGNKTGPTTNITTIQDVVASQSIINGQKVDFSNSKTRDTTVDIKGQLVQIDANGNPVDQPENANGQALSNQVDLEKNRAAIGILDRDGNPQTQDEYYGVNTVKTIYDEPTKTRTSGDATIEGDSIVLTSTTTVDGTLTGTKTTSVNASGITTSRINGNGTNGALVLHGGTTSTTQTLDDNGVSFVTTNAGGIVTGTTTIDANGNLTVKGVNVTDAINAATTDRAAIRTEFATADTTLQNNIDAEATTRANADNAATTDRAAIRTEFATADTTLQNNIDAEATTRANADNAATTDRAAIRNEAAAETVRVNKAIVDGDAATLTSAKGYTDTTATTLRSEAAAETVRVNKAIVDGDAATLTSAKGYTDTTATTLRSEAAAETVRVNKAIVDGDAATLTSAKGYTDTKSAATLASANAYTDGRANQLNTRIDDVQKTAYRGIAIALAAQQAVPNIAPGQVAVFGGVGHYEGETAGSIGVVTSFTDRISASGAFGFAGGNEFGGRVGVAYVFGGK